MPNALPNGNGNLCYSDLGSCVHGANSCSVDRPCVSSVPDCQTGVAAGFASTHSYICKSSVPEGAQAILSGQYCYESQDAWCG